MCDCNKWLGIESAPKDGTRILVACQFKDGRINCVCDSFWNTMHDRWEDLEGQMTPEEITIWMPLIQPSLPSDDKQLGSGK